MRSNRKILSGAALVAATLLIYGIYTVTSNSGGGPVAPEPSNQPIAKTVSASARSRAVAAVDIPARAIITPDMLKMVDYNGPATNVFVTDLSQATGYITRVPIPAGAPLQRQNDLVGHISDVGIAGALQPGRRALVVPMANKPTLHDLVRIGNSVDILASFDSQEARTLVQNVRVLAVDVYGNDFPSVNVAMRGPYRADAKGNPAPPPPPPAAPGASPAEAPAPTPEPTPIPQNQTRPDPALTIEVTQQQAAAILLAQQSGAVIDFLIRPALPGNRSAEAVLVSSPDGTTTPGSTDSETGIKAVSVVKSQIAPYAERKKQQGSQPNRSNNSGGGGGGRDFSPPSFAAQPLPQPVPDIPLPTTPVDPGGLPATNPAPAAPLPPQTYQIPIYADGKTVRTETVLTPQD